MRKEELSDSKSDSSHEEVAKAPRNMGNQKKMSDYEKERMERIEENRARMEALGLKKMADLFMGSVNKTRNKSESKGKKKLVEDDDEEYRPPERDETASSSSDGEDLDDDYSRSGKKKAKKKGTTTKKRGQKTMSTLDFVDDDDALMQAIALSLQDSAGFLNIAKSAPSHKSGVLTEAENSGTKGSYGVKENAGKRKRKKMMSSRIQMTEDELLMHFLQFDEADKGSITFRDLRRVAAAHDFTWTEKEMEDMILYFDSDGDRKLSFDDFQNVVTRLNMLQSSESTF